VELGDDNITLQTKTKKNCLQSCQFDLNRSSAYGGNIITSSFLASFYESMADWWD